MENRYVSFVYAVNGAGRIVYRACGTPQDAEVDLLASVMGPPVTQRSSTAQLQ